MEDVKKLLEQTLDNLQNLANDPKALSGIPTGFIDLDRVLGGFNNSDLIVVGSRPAMGKTALLVNMALKQSVNYHIPVLFYTFEKTKNQIVRLILSSIAEIDGYKIGNGMLAAEDWDAIMNKAKVLNDEVPLYIVDNPSAKIKDFCLKVKKDMSQTGAKIVYIDNLHLFSSSLGYQSRYEEISACTRELKHLAKELDIPIVMASQINRNPEHRDAKSIEYYRPFMYDLRDSGTICEDSNVVILLDRPELKYHSYEDSEGNNIRGLTEVIIAKNHMGREDVVRLRFKPEFARFEDWKEFDELEIIKGMDFHTEESQF